MIKFYSRLSISFLALAIIGCDSTPEFSNEESLWKARSRAEERLALAKAKEADSYASQGLGLKSMDASSAVHDAQREVDRLSRARVNPRLDPLRNPDPSLKEQAYNVRWQIEQGWSALGGRDLCEEEHRVHLNQAKTPEEILRTAKWMLEDSLSKTEKQWKGWYKPGGLGWELAKTGTLSDMERARLGYPSNKAEKDRLEAEFKEKIERRRNLLAKVTALLSQTSQTANSPSK
jgi:hypothetical protein